MFVDLIVVLTLTYMHEKHYAELPSSPDFSYFVREIMLNNGSTDFPLKIRNLR